MSTVTEADRTAASIWCASQPFPSKQAEAPMIARGEYDHHSLVQAFAGHREAAMLEGARRMQEAAAVVAENAVAEQYAYAKAVLDHPGTKDKIDFERGRRHACDCLDIEGAIRALDPATVIAGDGKGGADG